MSTRWTCASSASSGSGSQRAQHSHLGASLLSYIDEATGGGGWRVPEEPAEAVDVRGVQRWLEVVVGELRVGLFLKEGLDPMHG
jgi:hypothetical protein